MGNRGRDSDLVIMPDGRRLTRRDFLALGLSAGAAAALAACTPETSTTPPGKAAPTKEAAPAKKLATHVSYATSSISDSLDPRWSLGQSGFQAARQLFDALVIFDNNSKIVGQLAREWKRIDAQTVEFKLRDDVKFSNGEDFTAETVRFSLENLLSSKETSHATTKERMGGLVEAEVVNSTTVRLKTKDPDPIVVNRVVSLLMVPPKYVGSGGDMATKPIGTGSFKPTEFVRSRHIAYEAWDESWRGKPTVRTARINQILEPATMIASLKTGEVDFIYNPPGDQVAPLKAEGYKVATVNANSCTMCTLVPTHPLMKKKGVREALNLAVNKEELLKTVQAGFGRVAEGQLLQPGMFGYNPNLKALPYDPERARSLLRQAGAQGAELKIMTTAATRPIMAAVAGYLNAVDLKVELELVEFAVLLQAMSRGTNLPMLGFNIEYTPTLDFDSAGIRFSSLVPQPQFDNTEFHRLYLEARQEVDEGKRETMIRRMAQLMYEEFAVLFLIWRDTPTVYSSKIADLHQRWDTSFELWKIEKEA